MKVRSFMPLKGKYERILGLIKCNRLLEANDLILSHGDKTRNDHPKVKAILHVSYTRL